MPTIIGAGDSSSGYEIQNSLSFAAADNAHLEKTFSGSSSSNRICTMSFWIKNADTNRTSARAIFSAIKSGSNEDVIKYGSSNGGNLGYLEFNFNNTNDGGLMPGTSGSQLFTFRDASAWYHFVIAIDTTDSTADDRLKFYVNGTRVVAECSISGGSVQADTPLSQNYDLGFLTASKHQIGMNVESNNSEPLDAYLSEFYFVDGTAYAPTTFAETNTDGIWVPKEAKDDISFGNYGFFLEFQQTGTSANSSGMGADTSGNDNHFSTSGLVALDVVADTPTNNFCVMNPNDNFYASGNFFEGNRNLQTNASAYAFNTSTFGLTNGKWYWEARVGNIGTGSDNWLLGITASPSVSASEMLGQHTYSLSYRNNGNYKTSDSNVTHGGSFGNDDIVMFALDLDNDRLYVGHGGQWADGSGNTDESDISNVSDSIIDISGLRTSIKGRTMFVAFGDGNGNASSTPSEAKINFGQPAYSNSSDESDGNGHGKFEYAPPSGFLAICTKNLAKTG